MIRRLLVGVVVSTLAAGSVARAQTPSTPGPEAQRLAAWVGTWQGENEVKGPQGQAVKMTLDSTCEWFPGHFQVVCRGVWTGPSGNKSETMSVFAYIPEIGTYRSFGMSSNGDADDATVTVAGNTWTVTTERTVGGKKSTTRTVYEMSGSSLKAQVERQTDGGSWTLVGEGKGTKVK